MGAELPDIISAPAFAGRCSASLDSLRRWCRLGWLDARPYKGRWWIWTGSYEGFIPPPVSELGGRPSAEWRLWLQAWKVNMPRLPESTWEAFTPAHPGNPKPRFACPHCKAQVKRKDLVRL